MTNRMREGKERGMKSLKWVLAALAATALVSGCKGFWDPLQTTGTGTGSASGVFYVLNSGKQQVAAFSFASGATTPTAISGGTVTLGAVPLAMAIAPTGNFLYVSTGGGIFAYSIGSGGVLTLLDNSQAISGDLPTSMVVDSSGAWLVESTSGSGTLNAIPLSSSTGLVDSTRTEQTLTSGLPVTTVQQIAISPSNASSPYVFVAMGAGGTAVIPFTAGSSGNPFGTVSTIKVKGSGGGANTVAVDPSNRLLYVGETVALSGTQTGGVRVFTIGSTSITEVSGSPYATAGTGPSAILATSDYVYVANRAVSGVSTGNVTGFAITSTGSVFSLTLVNTVTAGNGTTSLAEDSTSTYLLAVNAGGNPDLNTYTFDSTTQGKLDAGATAATGTDPTQPVAVVAVP